MNVLYGDKKIKYTIKQISPGLFAIEVPNKRDLALLFLRVQEFYESPNPKFQNNVFDVIDFLQWYQHSPYHLDGENNIDERESIKSIKSKNKSITKSIDAYVNDWSGFNFPFSVAKDCYAMLFDSFDSLLFNSNNLQFNQSQQNQSSNPLTIYDKLFLDIIDYIEHIIGKNQKAYIIGARKFISPTMRHEVFHGLYYLNDKYRKSIDKLINAMPRSLYAKYKKNLKNMGYRDGVINDEIQSYLGTGDWNFYELNINIDLSISRTLHHLFKNIFDYYFQY